MMAAAVMLAGCGGNGLEEGGSFDSKLRGTWETLSPSPSGYSGTLVIDWNSITITGYEPRPWPYSANDPERPFNGITKGVSRKGYSKDGKLYINDFGWNEGIPYTYDAGSSPAYTRLLRFTFGGRDETLKKNEG
jgi:hypothetical protein